MTRPVFINSDATRHVDSVANWYGRDGAVMDRVADLLDGCKWIGVPFAGGMGALAALRCTQGVATDLHHHVVNLAAVISDPELSDQLAERLAAIPHNEHVLTLARVRCMAREQEWSERVIRTADLFCEELPPRPLRGTIPDVQWALDYYIVSWMSRAGDAGTDKEFKGNLSVRWHGVGGSSSSRWRSAVASVPGWHDVLKRWSFVCMDAFEFLNQCLKTEAKTVSRGLYLDPPFPDAGEPYVHTFDEKAQIKLARLVSQFTKTRVVVRYHDHPLIRQLYPENAWTWHRSKGRAQTNEERDEVLLINGPSYTEGGTK